MEDLKTKDTYLENKKIVLALSGGIDSVVLLHYLHTHFSHNLRAIHINHHLSKKCDEWNTFCKKLCKSLNIKYKNIDVFVKNKSNIEENGRKERYRALYADLKKDEILCTAHHQNDQAETLLLQLFRGSGVAGLAAMPKIKILDKGILYRPLLNIQKKQIIEYTKNHSLSWIEDDSNTNTDFRRNFIRLEVLPKLEKIYPNLPKILARSAKHQAEALQLTKELAVSDISKNNIKNNNCLNITKLNKLNRQRIKNIIRYFIKSLDFLPPSNEVLNQILDLLKTKEDANPLVRWSLYEVRSYKNELYFINTNKTENTSYCPFFDEFKNSRNFKIRYRIYGQRVQLEGKKHSQALKKILQEANIPPWERDKLRMYFVNNELVAMEKIGKMQVRLSKTKN